MTASNCSRNVASRPSSSARPRTTSQRATPAQPSTTSWRKAVRRSLASMSTTRVPGQHEARTSPGTPPPVPRSRRLAGGPTTPTRVSPRIPGRARSGRRWASCRGTPARRSVGQRTVERQDPPSSAAVHPVGGHFFTCHHPLATVAGPHGRGSGFDGTLPPECMSASGRDRGTGRIPVPRRRPAVQPAEPVRPERSPRTGAAPRRPSGSRRRRSR